ncbi:MAG: putative ABC transport system ATP-binding protein [Planctomycetota bacterium]|jgi:putative ABC transport system ATP-binding protein
MPTTPLTPRVACHGLTKVLRSGTQDLCVLADVDLEVAPGESVAILGASGSGKSTLLGLLAGLDRPTSGEVFVEGQSLAELDEDGLARMRRGKVGFVFQAFHLLPNLTALENVRVPLELIGFEDAREQSEELLAAVGLAERTHHYPSQLSGGEMQRVALARAFGPRPRLILADEPTGNLDAATGERVLDLLFNLRKEKGTSLVLVTHDPALAARADRRLRLDAGRVVPETA